MPRRCLTVVLINKVQTSISGNEGGDCTQTTIRQLLVPSLLSFWTPTLLSVLDELNSNTLSNGRVRLLGLNSDLLEHDTLSVGRSSSGG